MRVLALWSYYRPYIAKFYGARPHLKTLSFAQQTTAILDDYFTWPPYVALRLRELGHEVEVIFGNNLWLNQAWAREHVPQLAEADEFSIIRARVERFNPDALWISISHGLLGENLRRLRAYCRQIYAWIAAPLPPFVDLSNIDCILTSHSNLVSMFRSRGMAAERLLPAFEPKILESLEHSTQRDIGCSFVGSVTWAHRERIAVLKRLAQSVPLRMWLLRQPVVSRSVFRPGFYSAMLPYIRLQRRSEGEVFGMEMFRVLARSRMTVNVHIGIADGMAGNQRMFESTGAGALLVTDGGANLGELFSADTEVISFSSVENLIEKIEYYEQHAEEAAAIARRGQARTLLQHSSRVRATELSKIFEGRA